MTNSANQVPVNNSAINPLHDFTLDSELEQSGYSIRTGNCSCQTEHWHGGIEILVIHNGAMGLDIGNDTAEMVSGNVAAFTSSTVHSTQPCSSGYLRTALHFAPDAAMGIHALSLISTIQDRGGLQLFTLNPDGMHRFLWCINELKTLRSKYKSQLTSKHILGLILTDVYSSKAFDPSPPVLRSIIEYMQANLNNREQFSKVAERFYISERHLARLFRTHLECSPQEYWLRLRINYACEVLRRPAPIKGVADSVGFDSLSGFQRAFRQMVGLSPSQYQEQCQVFNTVDS